LPHIGRSYVVPFRGRHRDRSRVVVGLPDIPVLEGVGPLWASWDGRATARPCRLAPPLRRRVSRQSPVRPYPSTDYRYIPCWGYPWNSNGQREGTSQPEEAWHRLPNGREVFLDPYVITFDDLDAIGEVRFNAIGLVEGASIYVRDFIRMKYRTTYEIASFWKLHEE
jgi:hypothetical protein